MNKKIALLVLPLICSACALLPLRKTEERYRNFLDDFIGKGDSYVVTQMGKPYSIDAIDSNTLKETYYHFVDEDNSKGGYLYSDLLSSPDTANKTQSVPYYDCRTVFAVRNGIVVDFAYEGSGCVR